MKLNRTAFASGAVGAFVASFALFAAPQAGSAAPAGSVRPSSSPTTAPIGTYKPAQLDKWCGANFTRENYSPGKFQSYSCTMDIETYCQPGMMMSAVVSDGSTITYSCATPPH
ncbi:hypothetical protein [Hyphococcus sp.]|uniref:hypothetical protein n=1 Tax=Hyphococcus sp. TaxID=2038636 RepID=UPI0035C750F5